MSVSEKNVRDLLDNPANTSVPQDTVLANITRAESFINKKATTTATVADKDHATAAMAVWLCYGSYMEGISQLLGNISVADQTKLDHLRKTAELFINEIASTYVDLDTDKVGEQMLGIPPAAFGLTTSEAFNQSS